jgi:RecB family exonuclease
MTLTATRPIRTTEVTLAPTALRDFGHCKRRFELVHLVRLPEPTPRALGGFRSDGNADVDARAEGDALHALLERVDLDAFGSDTTHATSRAEAARVLADASLSEEASRRIVASAVRFLTSDYARTVREGATLERERRFVVAVESPALTVTLRGAMDLVVRWPNGDVDVIDYKSARQADLAPHALQLDVYAYALHREASGGRIRSGAVFLGGEGKCAPRFRPAIDVGILEGRILDLAADMIASRASGRFVRAPAKTCHAIGCGFFSLCHPPTERRQLDLFR